MVRARGGRRGHRLKPVLQRLVQAHGVQNALIKEAVGQDPFGENADASAASDGVTRAWGRVEQGAEDDAGAILGGGASRIGGLLPGMPEAAVDGRVGALFRAGGVGGRERQ